ncbi:MAG: hypothetical protein ABIT36_10650 [Steroidobacteraceae bacterium]
MSSKAILAAVLIGIGGGAVGGMASARDWNDSRHERREDRREERRDNRYERSHDRRHWNDSRWYSHRYYPAPRYYRYGPPRAPGWREPYGRGYRSWRNDRYYFIEPGRPAVELSFVLPLR